uniref:La ribonucleoprotein 6, translational regulator n=4 Tax=Cercopithecidae TaxID=9527 RepID=A0A2K5V8V2_MACFA
RWRFSHLGTSVGKTRRRPGSPWSCGLRLPPPESSTNRSQLCCAHPCGAVKVGAGGGSPDASSPARAPQRREDGGRDRGSRGSFRDRPPREELRKAALHLRGPACAGAQLAVGLVVVVAAAAAAARGGAPRPLFLPRAERRARSHRPRPLAVAADRLAGPRGVRTPAAPQSREPWPSLAGRLGPGLRRRCRSASPSRRPRTWTSWRTRRRGGDAGRRGPGPVPQPRLGQRQRGGASRGHSGTTASGGENEREDLEQEWKPPDEELIKKLVDQIEFYFSDENLEKDAFLLKHVRRNKLGYVSVKLLTSFKKVKHLTRDWRTTAHALKYSVVLELNEDHRKVRRTTPVPLFPNENLPSKMLLVYDLYLSPKLWALATPQKNGRVQEKVMEHLLKLFGTFGVISSVRILKPGRELPPDIRRISSRYSQVGTQECAIVEFEEVEAAIKAHEFMITESQGKENMKAVLIGMKPPKKKPAKDKNHDEEPTASIHLNKSLNKRVEELQYMGDESSANSSSDPESNPTSPMAGRRHMATNKLSPSGHQNLFLSPNASPCTSPWSSPLAQRKGVSRKSPLAEEGRLNCSTSPEIFRKCMDYSSDSSVTPSGSPWVRRRRQAEMGTQEKSPGVSPLLSRKMQTADGLPVGVLRLPRGPDNTRGFHGHERSRACV